MQFSDRRMPDHRIFQWLHHQLRETRSFHVTRYDAGRGRTVRSPSLEESNLWPIDQSQVQELLLITVLFKPHGNFLKVLSNRPYESSLAISFPTNSSGNAIKWPIWQT
ncbi:hypothetical protein TNCV_4653361 [Trichonephila clavipes]|nr:hypothetical protein TNCV_4653361 [Trichonephila clavipes]